MRMIMNGESKEIRKQAISYSKFTTAMLCWREVSRMTKSVGTVNAD
jgi:hypothetical protein